MRLGLLPVWLALAAVGMTVAACSNAAKSSGTPSSLQSGEDRFADEDDDGRETVVIRESDSGDGTFDIAPASFDTVLIRSVPEAQVGDFGVEALVKGSFPDACTELHDITQARSGDRQIVELTMRRSRDAVCAQVVRPYRYFFELDGRFSEGAHTLVLNDREFVFQVE